IRDRSVTGVQTCALPIYGLSVLDKSYTHYSKEYKEHAIKRVLLGNESINAVALDLGLPGNGMLSNWIRSYKENGYNVVIKKKGRSEERRVGKESKNRWGQ